MTFVDPALVRCPLEMPWNLFLQQVLTAAGTGTSVEDEEGVEEGGVVGALVLSAKAFASPLLSAAKSLSKRNTQSTVCPLLLHTLHDGHPGYLIGLLVPL